MPPKLSPSGALRFETEEHTLCGLCRTPYKSCECKGLKDNLHDWYVWHGVPSTMIPSAKDRIFVGLPPPPDNSSRTKLVKRWVSLVNISMIMGHFDANHWFSTKWESLNASMDARTKLLNEMVADYVAQLPTNTELTVLARVLGLQRRAIAGKVDGIAKEAWAALRIFLSGDWACMSKAGSKLLMNAFNTRDPKKYPRDDPHLERILDSGVSRIYGVMEMGFDKKGYCLAMEPGRRPCGVGTSTTLETSDERLISKKARKRKTTKESIPTKKRRRVES
ncbi:expressed unknown protein [Seminavis robusta]|uniref:Uncharacterized protein n=1 Tax=Seminavis robusta TaxID=568900 RepID=A0A9N8HUI5_9STRA|nr:expressed unknown protein [Seminavis robusta]|eukprot:Sro1823_g299900.1 n/a (278) ;mRNA; r:7882-8715